MNTYYLDQIALAIHSENFFLLKDLIDAHITLTGNINDEEGDYVFAKIVELKQAESPSS